jgi:hypothetical protein
LEDGQSQNKCAESYARDASQEGTKMKKLLILGFLFSSPASSYAIDNSQGEGSYYGGYGAYGSSSGQQNSQGAATYYYYGGGNGNNNRGAYGNSKGGGNPGGNNGE